MAISGNLRRFWPFRPILAILGYFWSVSIILAIFGRFRPILVILNTFQPFGSFLVKLTICGRFQPCSSFMAIFGPFRLFRPILINPAIFDNFGFLTIFDQVRPFWHFNDFGPFKGIFDQNLVVRYQVIFILGLLWSNFAGFVWG